MLILLIGDFYYPEREIDIPLKFKKLLVPGKISLTLCTGNLSKKLMEYLETVCPTIVTVRGESDSIKIKERATVEYEGFKIGIVNTCILDRNDVGMKQMIARQMDVDILVTGGTHMFKSYEKHGRYYIDPGSATGAFTLDSEDIVPTFVLMDLSASGFSLYIYKLVGGQVKVEKVDYLMNKA